MEQAQSIITTLSLYGDKSCVLMITESTQNMSTGMADRNMYGTETEGLVGWLAG